MGGGEARCRGAPGDDGVPCGADFSGALALLRRHFGFERFRPAQEAVIRAVLRGRDVLAVLPTGAGKSVCFQVPALLGPGLTVVVSPLIALMDDQVAGARRRGIPAAALTSAQSAAARRRVERSVLSGETRLLYVSPERLASRRFLELVGRTRVSRLAVDEAHCISEWGHDFRPSYRRIAAFREAAGRPPTIALTATATRETRADIVENLRLRSLAHVVCSVDRPNLAWRAARLRGLEEGTRAVLRAVRSRPGAAIVYVPTRQRAVWLAHGFRRLGSDAAAYHAGLSAEVRQAVQEAFLGRRLRIVCATNAFGMGIDHPEVRLVCHLGSPGSLEAYVQEAGRAGRDGRPAECLLVACPGDARLQRAFLRQAWPSPRTLARVWSAAPAGRPVTAADLRRGGLTGLPREAIESAFRLLVEFGCAREAPPAAAGRGGARGRPAVVRGPDRLRTRIDFGAPARGRRRGLRRLRALRSYLAARGCRRAAIAAYFDEPAPPCAGCDRCDRRNRPTSRPSPPPRTGGRRPPGPEPRPGASRRSPSRSSPRRRPGR